jgi:hypothetical protein
MSERTIPNRALLARDEAFSMIPKSGCRFSEKIMLKE